MKINFPRVFNKMIVIDLAIHFTVAAVFSLVIFQLSRSWYYLIIFLLGAVFVDLDHLIDYYICYKSGFNLKNFLNCNFVNSGKVYVLLHSWEINLICFVLGLWYHSGTLLVLALGLCLHLAADNLQRRDPLFYLLIYRIYRRFKIKDAYYYFVS